MNRKIWKFVMPAKRGVYVVEMPLNSVIKSIQEQGHNIAIWAAVNPEEPPTNFKFTVIHTGEDEPKDGYHYFATIQVSPDYVLHIYKK